MYDPLSERIVEDILSSDKFILAELLSVNPAELSLIARQKMIPSGKLDLLYLHADELLLIELKVVQFHDEIIRQVNQYSEDVKELQKQRKLVGSKLRKIVLVTDAKAEDYDKCEYQSIQLITYKPESVLSRYYENFKERSRFLEIRSGDYGVVRLGLLKPTLRLLAVGKNLEEICHAEGKSAKTIRNRLAVASRLNLVVKFRQEHFLTDFGAQWLEEDPAAANDRLDDEQVRLLASFVTENPFYSSVTYTIFTIVESVFVLAKNIYPVPMPVLEDYFVKSVGKQQTWRTSKARYTATYIFSNYACELEFLAKVNNNFYITPKGIHAVLLLQLNRSIKLIESQDGK